MSGSALERHRAALFEFSAQLLGEYVRELKARPGPFDQKEFNDPIWQTIVVKPFEVLVLDSPLLQRLRLIRQLGVVHYVYPGATHSRFEHSLGVLHQLQNLISAINSRSATAEQVIVTANTTNLMRLIALCHDVGHGVMSHVSENALRDFESIEEIQFEFARQVGVEAAKPSELAAFYITQSPAFIELLEVARSKVHESLPSNFLELIPKAIMGIPISDEIPLLHELINGPFDADKLDYMPRDARMTGIPVVTDIPRLIQKVRAVQVRQDQLPDDAAQVMSGRPYYVMTGIALSGGRTLDELMLGRTLLFDKIYRHQKVRAAEAMVASLLENLVILGFANPPMLPYVVTDDQLINLDRSALSQLMEDVREDQIEARIVMDLAKRLRERRLFVRAFAFAQHMPLDPYAGDEKQRAGLNRLILTAGSRERNELVKSIAADVSEIFNLLGLDELKGKFPHEALASYIKIGPPDAPSHGSEIHRAYLITPDREVLRFSEETAEARGWTDAYPLARDLGFFFTVQELAPYVFLATEKLVRMRFGARIPRSMLAYIKQTPLEVDKLRRRLADVGYYSGAPFDVQPIPKRLTLAGVENQIESLVDRLGAYSGPLSASDLADQPPERKYLSKSRVVDWLRQFGEDDFIDGALDLITRVRLIGRPEIISAVTKFVDQDQSFAGSFLCPLGEPKDSSAIITYQAADAGRTHGLRVVSLTSALVSPEQKPILFVEDILGSGKQAVTILENLLGETNTYDLHEERKALPAPLAEVFRNKRIGFVFAAGTSEGYERLSNHLSKMKLNATINIGIKEDELPTAFHKMNAAKGESLRSRCAEIGRALLRYNHPDRSEEWIEDKVLGYGNRGFLILFPYNTPAQTLTCLWAEGLVDGKPWLPLFPRRKKI